MVSLRERKARPSYTNIPQGLENLTDSEEEKERAEDRERARGSKSISRLPGTRPESPSGHASPKGSVRSGGPGGGDGQESLSSGDSSEFELSDHGRGKSGRGRGRGGARGRGSRDGSTRKNGKESSGSDSTDEELNELEVMDGEDDEEEDEDEDEDEDDEDEDGEGMDMDEGGRKSKGKKAPKAKTTRTNHTILARGTGGGSTGRRSKTLASGPAYIQSDLNLVPPAYRALIRSSAEAMVKPTLGRVWPHARPKAIDAGGFPTGSVTPFVSRLVDGTVELRVAEKAEERRARAVRVEKGNVVGIGEEGWEGEGWYREMKGDGGGGQEGKGKGKGKASGQGQMPVGMEGWKLRGEVRLGLDIVGRKGLGELEFVVEKDTAKYLPKATGVTTVHIGKHDKQKAVKMRMFEQVDTGKYDTLRSSYLFSAGGPIWGQDWCPLPEEQAAHYNHTQFLAISTLPDIDFKPAAGEKLPTETLSAIQIWSTTLPSADSEEVTGRMKCEIVLCVKGGPGWAVKWMPMGAWDDCDPAKLDKMRLPKIGILTVVHLDGSISVYAVPHPLAIKRLQGDKGKSSDKPMFLKCHEPLLRIEVADAAATCMDWFTGSKLAVGYSNGSVGMWDIAEALRTGQREDLLPHLYLNVAQSCISSISAGRVPSSKADGSPNYDDDPRFLVLGSWDGTLNMLDMRDPGHPLLLHRARLPYMTVGWSSQNQSPLSADSDYNVFMYKIKGVPAQRHGTIIPHRGSIWDVGSSDYHTMIASASADGSVCIGSTQSGFYRPRKAPLFYWRLLEMDYDRVTGHYRLLDDFLPETMTLDKASGRKPKKKGLLAQGDATAMKAGNWDPRVAIHRTTWNEGSGIARAGMLAVGTASGLGLVQVINPNWRSGVDTSKIGA